MYLFNKPSSQQINEFIVSQARLDFTYSMVGATKHEDSPSGFVVDHNRVCLGKGKAIFEIAKQSVSDWNQFRFDWIELHRLDTITETDQTVGVLAHALGLWVLNACRVVYVIEETEPVHRFAVGYGTLPEHAESGEERFQVEWHPEDDSVWYDILAFSRPNQLLSKLAYPYVRRKQKQFAVDSKQAMKDAIAKAQK
ncbi:DUF1990 family protein [Gimesia aquarii]|uniref:DUF1990 domain-containing protein n=1 Tax=Gimesia aquarii TaxID=2527964 RepID=A0A517WYS0_9PLAN|nr:DUF1990 domain-containing protein [Gimesia aquarii]QDU10409.1 hypothetical protein V202x_38080 [Gimesia aquarii]